MKLTLREAILAVIVIGVGALLFNNAMQPRRALKYKVQCAGNLQQIGLAMAMYAQDNHGFYPPASIPSPIKWQATPL